MLCASLGRLDHVDLVNAFDGRFASIWLGFGVVRAF